MMLVCTLVTHLLLDVYMHIRHMKIYFFLYPPCLFGTYAYIYIYIHTHISTLTYTRTHMRRRNLCFLCLSVCVCKHINVLVSVYAST
jgi:hypothetical protein